MIPHDPDRCVINPRLLARDEGLSALAAKLREVGYCAPRAILSDHSKALTSGKPHLLEGERGSGKTAFAEGLVAACNLPLFYLQGMEGLGLGDVLYSWDTEGQNQWVAQALESGMTLEAARARQWSRDYLVLGEALAAYDFSAREQVVSMLIIDEFDKLTEGVMNMLLQLFGRGWAHVPRVGAIGFRDFGSRTEFPVVVLTSNNAGRLSPPLRSRCVYTWVEPPTPAEGVAILRARVPNASAAAVLAVAKLLDSVKGIAGIEERPALREGIDLLEQMSREGVEQLDEQRLRDYLCLVAKTESDRWLLRQSLGRLEDDVTRPHDEFDAWVARAFGLAESPAVC